MKKSKYQYKTITGLRVPFEEWLNEVQREQKHYPLFKGEKLNEKFLLELYNRGKSPIDALNDLSTAC